MQCLSKKEARLVRLLGTDHVRARLEQDSTRSVAVKFDTAHLIKHQSGTHTPTFYYYTFSDGCEEWHP